MGGLWGSRSSDATPAEASNVTAQPGSIEMKGSRRPATATKPRLSSFWPVSSLRSPRMAPQEEKPAEPSGGKQLQLSNGPGVLEALVQTNTPTLLTCSPRGLEITPRGRQEDDAGPSGSPEPSVEGAPEAGSEQDFHEVQLVFRIPRVQPGNAGTDPAGKTLEEVTEELAVREQQRRRAADALSAKTQECENLLRVVRELTESRNRLSGVRAVQTERLADLQHDYMRLARVADLSRAVSRENIAKSAQSSQQLNQVEEELAHQKALNAQVRDRNARLKMENAELREKLCLLERLDVFAYQTESTCMLNFKQYHLKETY